MALVPMTRLEAINLMLSAIGEAPVETLGDASVQAVDLAERVLDETSYEIQAAGYSFNEEYNFPLTADGNGYMQLPSNCIRCDVDPVQGNSDMDVVVRGTKLYDRFKRTAVFTTSPIYVSMVILLDYTDLPDYARRYVAVRAARKLQDRVLGSEALHSYTEQDELDAKALFMTAELDNADHTIFDNWSTFKSINRPNR